MLVFKKMCELSTKLTMCDIVKEAFGDKETETKVNAAIENLLDLTAVEIYTLCHNTVNGHSEQQTHNYIKIRSPVCLKADHKKRTKCIQNQTQCLTKMQNMLTNIQTVNDRVVQIGKRISEQERALKLLACKFINLD